MTEVGIDVTIHSLELFVTPVWEVQTSMTETDCLDLLADAPPWKEGQAWNFFEATTDRVIDFRRNVETLACGFAQPHYDRDVEMTISRAWVNRDAPGIWNTVHDHAGCPMVAVFYAQADADCGDLMLVDPRGAFGWREEKGKGNRSFHRITPVVGKLVFFPGFVKHYTEVNRSERVRTVLAMNFFNRMV